MRVLITNLFVDHNSGTETVVEILADGLRRAGHQPMIYAPMLGPQAERMRVRGHVLADRLDALPARPDVIHAQHVTPTLMAIAAFPGTPVLYACHSSRFALETPVLHPSVRRYVAVDGLCRDRCLAAGVPEDRLSVILNAVDLERFLPRPPLPARPARALLLGKRTLHRTFVQAACAAEGLELHELGKGAGKVSAALEHDLVGYDIVFASARCAIEAAAVGCAVVVCDGRGFAGMLTAADLPAWRPMNFGAGVLVHPNSVEALRRAIRSYDPVEAARVSALVRADAGLEQSVADHLELYRQCLADPPPAGDAGAAAMARLLEDYLPTPAERPWRELVSEQGLTPRRPDEVLEAMETRLLRAVDLAGKAAAKAAARDGALEDRLLKAIGLSDKAGAREIAALRADVRSALRASRPSKPEKPPKPPKPKKAERVGEG